MKRKKGGPTLTPGLTLPLADGKVWADLPPAVQLRGLELIQATGPICEEFEELDRVFKEQDYKHPMWKVLWPSGDEDATRAFFGHMLEWLVSWQTAGAPIEQALIDRVRRILASVEKKGAQG